MSSVRDRIRNLQQNDRPNTTSETDTPNSDTSLGARVARFNNSATPAPSAISKQVKKSMPVSKSLLGSLGPNIPNSSPPFQALASTDASTNASTKPPVARRTASDTEDGRAPTHIRPSDKLQVPETSVNNARRLFETHAAASNPPSHNSKTDQKPSVFSRAAVFEGSANLNTNSNNGTTAEKTDDAVASRAAMFEKLPSDHVVKNDTNNKNTKTEKINKSDDKAKERDKHSDTTAIPSAPRRLSVENKSMEKKPVENKQPNITSELAEVKSMNNKLIKSLLELTEGYRRLEISRDNLQKRISELEAGAK